MIEKEQIRNNLRLATEKAVEIGLPLLRNPKEGYHYLIRVDCSDASPLLPSEKRFISGSDIYRGGKLAASHTIYPLSEGDVLKHLFRDGYLCKHVRVAIGDVSGRSKIEISDSEKKGVMFSKNKKEELIIYLECCDKFSNDWDLIEKTEFAPFYPDLPGSANSVGVPTRMFLKNTGSRKAFIKQ